jgi:nicotinate dehydrogenase subunit A
MGCLAVSLPPGINAEARIPMTENSAATIVAAATPVATPTKNQSITLNVNGRTTTVSVDDPDMPLLYALRNDLHLHGPRFGCGLGQCGACTVHVDGVATRSCITPISTVGNGKIVTLEGLGTADKPHPVQAAFIEEQAVQCGYCINGMIMQSAAFLEKNKKPSDDEIREELANNLCRCGTHVRILRAVKRAAGTI